MRKLSELYQAILNKQLYAAILIGIVCLSVHGVTLLNDYNLDDNLVTQNHRLTSKGISAIPEIYRSPYYQDDMGYSYGYRPTTLASFAIEKSLFGESALVSHTINLALYLATCLLIFFLIKRIFPDKVDMALFAALLFTVHPIHTEVVASIKNRDEILALLFMLLAFWSFFSSKAKDSLVKKIIILTSGVMLIGLSVSSKLSAASILILLPLVLNKTFQLPFRIIAYLSVVFIVDGLISKRSNNSFIHPALFALTLSLIDVASSKTFITLIISRALRLGRNTRVTISQKNMRLKSFTRECITHFRKRLRVIFVECRKSIFKFISTATRLVWTTIFPPNVGRTIFHLSVEVPSILIILVLFFAGGLPSVLMLLISWKLTALLPKKIQSWVLNNGIIVMLVALVFAEEVVLVPFLLPIILFKNYLSTDRSSFKLRQGFSLLIIGLILASIDLLVLALADGGGFVDGILFAIYSLTLVTTLVFKTNTHYAVRTNIIFQIGLSILSFLVGFLIFPQAGFYLLITQIGPIIILTLMVASLSSYRLPTQLKTVSIKLILVVIIFAHLMPGIMLAKQAIFEVYIPDMIFTTTTRVGDEIYDSSEDLTLLSKKIASEGKLTLKNYEERWIIPFQKNWNRTVANSTSPVKFDSQYVESTVKQLKTISADVGRPLDFTENPISPFASFPVKLGLAITNTSRILANLIVPVELSFYYGFNEIWVTNLLETPTIIILLFLLGITLTGIFMVFSGNAIAGIALLMTLICIVPFSGIVEPLPGIYAPRFSYVASFFFCISITDLFSSWSLIFWNKSKVLLYSARFSAFIILIVIGLFSANRNMDWKNKLTLMTKDIKSVPNSAQANNLLAHAIMENVFVDNTFSNNESGSVKQAAKHFARATTIYPFFFNAWVDLAKVNSLLGNQDLALKANIRAFNIDDTYSPVIASIAETYESLGDTENAIFYYQKYVNAAPQNFVAYDNLARILFQEKRYLESAEVCEAYLKLDPSNPGFRQNLSILQNLLNDSSTLDGLEDEL
jgi:hypothetical protein